MIQKLSKEQFQNIIEKNPEFENHNFNLESFDIKSMLSNITVLEIVNKIAKFRKVNLKDLSDKDLFDELTEAISIDYNGLKQSVLFPRLAEYPAHTRFYRVRKINSEDSNFPNKTISKEQDVWNPPTQFVTRPGRLNKERESLLYTAPINPYIAIEEMKIQDNEKFGLIVYESKSPIKVVMIGLWEDIPELTEEENLKLRMYSDFLYTEFTRDVGIGTEYLYRVSELITKNYFDLPPRDVQDAWCYPSVASKKQVNVCFRPNIAKELLEFVGVQFCQLKRIDKEMLIKCNYIAADFNTNRELLYYPVNSEKCRLLFPEINLSVYQDKV